MSIRIFRRRIAAWTTFGLVAASLVAITPAANANGDSGPIGPSDFSFSRESTDGFSFVVKPGESAGLQSYTSVIDTWSGWPLQRNTVLSRNAFKVTTLPADVEQYDWDYRSWQLNDWQNNDCDFYPEGNTVKVTTAMTCARNLWVSDTITVENNSLTTKTVRTNAASLRVKYGKKTIGVSDSRIDGAVANISITDEDSAVITAAEDNVGLGFTVCLAEETLSANDTLTVHPVVTLDDVALSKTAFNVYGWSEGVTVDGWDGDVTDVTEPDSLSVSYTVPELEDGEELENLIVGLGIYPVNTVPGTYAGSVDVKREGISVTEPCPNYEAVGWPTLTTTPGVAGSADATISSNSDLPADALTTNDNFDQYSSQPDGFGGMFYWGYPGADWEDNPNSVVSVVHLDGDTPNNDLAGVGEIEINTGKYGYFEIARFGEDGQNWFTLVSGNKGAYSFSSGTMSSAATTTANFTGKALDGLCGRGFSAGYVAAVSAATVNPLLHVYCNNGAITKSVLAKVVAGRASVVTTLDTGTRTRPCVVTSIGTDTRASGTEAAVVVYTRVSSKDVDGDCGSEGATISSRSITTVTAALAATKANVNGNPWIGRDEPAFINIAAGTAPGTWFGVTNEIEIEIVDGWEYYRHFPVQLFSMTTTAIAIESDDLVFDELPDFGDGPMVTPLAQLSPTQWSLMITGSVEFDGEGIGRATVATINRGSGDITNGDIVEMTGMGYQSSRIIASFSSDSDGNATMYTVTGEDTYKSAVWAFLE